MHRTTSAVIAAALLTIGLAACGGGDPGGGTSDASGSTSRTSTADTSRTSTTEPGAGEEGSSSSSTSDSPQPSVTTAPDEDGDTGATTITTVWVDDSWAVEEVSQDVCGPGELYGSQFSRQDDIFTCGPTAAGVQACAAVGTTVTCITSPVERTAIRFTSTADTGQVQPREGSSIPLYVELDGGVECTTVSHDHDQHWGQRFSWYRCSDGSELLTEADIGDTFDTSGRMWTVQRSQDKAKPTSTPVRTAVFAGR